MTTHIVGYFVGSLAKNSINRKLATALVRLAPPGAKSSKGNDKETAIIEWPESRDQRDAPPAGRTPRFDGRGDARQEHCPTRGKEQRVEGDHDPDHRSLEDQEASLTIGAPIARVGPGRQDREQPDRFDHHEGCHGETVGADEVANSGPGEANPFDDLEGGSCRIVAKPCQYGQTKPEQRRDQRDRAGHRRPYPSRGRDHDDAGEGRQEQQREQMRSEHGCQVRNAFSMHGVGAPTAPLD